MVKTINSLIKKKSIYAFLLTKLNHISAGGVLLCKNCVANIVFFNPIKWQNIVKPNAKNPFQWKIKHACGWNCRCFPFCIFFSLCRINIVHYVYCSSFVKKPYCIYPPKYTIQFSFCWYSVQYACNICSRTLSSGIDDYSKLNGKRNTKCYFGASILFY